MGGGAEGDGEIISGGAGERDSKADSPLSAEPHMGLVLPTLIMT